MTSESSQRGWHHSPAHHFAPDATYMITAGTLHKTPILITNAHRDAAQTILFDTADEYGWQLQAWAIMPNHYHLVAFADKDARDVKTFAQRLHSQTSRKLNKLDGVAGRQVWFEYWDTALTYERSYHAQLNYVHTNPVKHGYAEDATLYPWCSAAWFALHAEPGFHRKIMSFKCDKINVRDDF